MATEVTIGGRGALFVGEDKTLRLEVLDPLGVPVDLTGFSILFDMRLRDSAPDPAVLSKTATIVGVYNATRASNTQRAQVVFTDTELNTVKPKTYRYSWKRMDDYSETVLAYGDMIFQKATAP